MSTVRTEPAGVKYIIELNELEAHFLTTYLGSTNQDEAVKAIADEGYQNLLGAVGELDIMYDLYDQLTDSNPEFCNDLPD